jgi:5-methyltetrahydropteroyltriglutamate--homocysteine methyltransferase
MDPGPGSQDAFSGTSFTRLRVDHTGGLRRPDFLRDLYGRYRRDEVTEQQLRAGQERAIREVIAKQEELGLPFVTDGELARLGGFQESFGGAVSGFDALPYKAAPSPPPPPKGDLDRPVRVESGLPGPGPAILHRLPVTERLRLVRNVVLEEYRFAVSVARRPVKVTLIGPDRISQRFEYETSGHVYASMEEFLSDVVAIERQMISEVVDAGCRYVQIDEPGYTAYVDPVLTERMRARGEDPARNLERSIQADNELIAGFPGVTFAVHICRGGGGGRGGPAYHREGPYDPIAEALFSGADFDRFLLEYDSDQAGSFEPLRFMPRGKLAVLGLLSNHGEAESAEYLQRRIDEASGYLPLDQLGICPRCGMGGIEREAAQWAKLEVLCQVASSVWGSLLA